MDMRTKAYPPLPQDRSMSLVLPRTGDLRFRPQVPKDFKQRLFIHSDPRRRFWYNRFQLKRKFIVMSTRGDLYAKTSVSTLSVYDLPQKTVLSMPRVGKGDLVKVLDLVQCATHDGHKWELVLTRWRNNMETWLALEVVQLFAPNLLQEFYVNSINSWAFHNRVQPGNLTAFRTEVELWLFHQEFQVFYRRLREKRGGSNAAVQPQPQTSQYQRVKHETAPVTVQATHTQPTPPLTQPNHHFGTTRPEVILPGTTRPDVDPAEAAIRAFEERRLARERLEQEQRNQQVQQQRLQQQQQREAQRLQNQEEERQRQHERQRQKVQDDLHRRQQNYQRRLNEQKERERLAEQQEEEKKSQERAKEQEKMRQRLARQNLPLQHATTTLREPQMSAHHLQSEQTGQPSKAKLRQKESDGNSIWTRKDGDDAYSPSENEESEESDGSLFSGDSDASEEGIRYQPSRTRKVKDRSSRKRRRKRLLYSQIEADDDDELPDLSQPPPSTRQQKPTNVSRRDNSGNDTSANISPKKSNRRKRLRQSNLGENSAPDTNDEIDLTQLPDNAEDKGDRIATPPKSLQFTNGSIDPIAEIGGDDDDSDDDLDFEPPIILGEIRCACGAESVGGYRGQWLQCWNEDCGNWEHADCVGLLTNTENNPIAKYRCTRCDPTSYLARCVQASQHILDWLFQCCDSRNSKQLMELLRDNTGAANLPLDWKNSSYENRTLAMHASRNGLTECLRYLIDERKVDICTTDAESRNVLHHAALGGSVACCRLLLKHDRKLLLHQDLRGRSPFHCMLQNVKVNRLCLPFMRENLALVGISDLDSNFPIHYACRAVNSHTVNICRMIFDAQPTMLQEKGGDGLYPLMILCKAAVGTASSRRKTANANIVASAKEIIAMMLDIDVFGDCLNQVASNGWSSFHYAAASGNHELITHLCKIGLFDVNGVVKKTGQTALHLAAQENHTLCVRALLNEGLNVVAKDVDGWIPLLYAENTTCIQEFMHYKLTKQLSRLHRMLAKYQQQGIVHRWQRRVALSPTCFDILNDWCWYDPERIERMEGLLLANPFLLRLDNKINYISSYIIPSIKKAPGRSHIVDQACEDMMDKKRDAQRKKLIFSFSRDSGCFWQQFVGMGSRLEPEDFRWPIAFSIKRSGGNNRSSDNREANLKLVLIRLAAGLVKEVPGLLIRDDESDSQSPPLSSDKTKLEAQLLGCYLLGELVAHFVIFAVPLSGILDFVPSFLRCISCKGKYRLAEDDLWAGAGRSFAAGFDAVLPGTLELFRADDLRVLFKGKESSVNALLIDWDTAVDWNVQDVGMIQDENTEDAKVWFPRLMKELVEEEQQLLLLFMTETFQLVNEYFFRSESRSGRITIASYSEIDSVLNHDAMLPTMEIKSKILRLPSYSCYDAFKKGMLVAIRQVDHAFLPN